MLFMILFTFIQVHAAKPQARPQKHDEPLLALVAQLTAEPLVVFHDPEVIVVTVPNGRVLQVLGQLERSANEDLDTQAQRIREFMIEMGRRAHQPVDLAAGVVYVRLDDFAFVLNGRRPRLEPLASPAALVVRQRAQAEVEEISQRARCQEALKAEGRIQQLRDELRESEKKASEERMRVFRML